MVLDAIARELTQEEIELFHTLARNTKSIKKTKDKQIEILRLKIKIKEIRAKILNQMTEREQFDELLKLEDKLLFFNQYNEVTLEQDDFEILEKLYRVYFNKFSIFNKTCNSCVKELLHVCISRYSALKKQFDKVEVGSVESNKHLVNEQNPFNPKGHDDVAEEKVAEKPKEQELTEEIKPVKKNKKK